MSVPPTLLPTADGSDAVTAGVKRKLDSAEGASAAELEASAKQLRPDAAGAAAGAAFLNAALLSRGLGGLPGVVRPAAYQPPLLAAAAAASASATPQSAAAFVAGAAAVTQALFQQRGAAAAAAGEGGAAAAAAEGAAKVGAAAAAAGSDPATAATAAEGVSDVLAADIARAAAAAAAAISARQSTANTAAKAFQMALKTAEMLQGSAGGGSANASATLAAGAEPSTHTRHARKVYVGNLPVPVTQTEVQQYFNELLDSLLPNKVPGQTIIHVYVNGARRFAFLEHRSIEEANFTIGLDGISWRNCCLSLRRPQDYNPTLAEQQYQEERSRQGSLTGFAVPPPSAAASPAAAPHSALIAGALGIVSTTVPDSPHKIFIGGLPHSITEPACKQLLEAFGQLRALHVVKDPQRGDCKGFAFCEYLDPNVTDVAVAGLNNMRIGDRVLQVRRAMPHGHMKGSGPEGSPVCPPTAPSIVGTLSRVLAIHNMLPPLPLVPKLLRDAVATEARIRAAAYGEVVCVDVQEALATQAAAKGEGVPVLVEFKDVDTAIQAMSGIQGSTYDGRPLSVVFSEPSAAMKKAAVMRIVMEAGGSPLPAKLTPSPPPDRDSESRGSVVERQVDPKLENSEQEAKKHQQEQQQAKPEQGQAVEQEQQQQQKAEEHQQRTGESAAGGAAEQPYAKSSTELKTEAMPGVTGVAMASTPADDGRIVAQRVGTAAAALLATTEVEPKEQGGAATVKEEKEKAPASSHLPSTCKPERSCRDASPNFNGTEGSHTDVTQAPRKDEKADDHTDGGRE